MTEECPTHSPGLHVGQGPQGHSAGLPHSHQQRMERLCSRTGDEHPDRLRGECTCMAFQIFLISLLQYLRTVLAAVLCRLADLRLRGEAEREAQKGGLVAAGLQRRRLVHLQRLRLRPRRRSRGENEDCTQC